MAQPAVGWPDLVHLQMNVASRTSCHSPRAALVLEMSGLSPGTKKPRSKSRELVSTGHRPGAVKGITGSD